MANGTIKKVVSDRGFVTVEPQDYIDRISRTGRAGASGTAISLVSPEEVGALRGVQRLLRGRIPLDVVEEFLPDPDGAPSPDGRARVGTALRRRPTAALGFAAGRRHSAAAGVSGPGR